MKLGKAVKNENTQILVYFGRNWPPLWHHNEFQNIQKQLFSTEINNSLTIFNETWKKSVGCCQFLMKNQLNFLFHFISFNSKEISHLWRQPLAFRRHPRIMRNFFWIEWNEMKKKFRLGVFLSWCRRIWFPHRAHTFKKDSKWLIFGACQNGSNDFSKILHTPLILAKLFFGKIFGPPKMPYDVIRGVKNPQKWVFWT